MNITDVRNLETVQSNALCLQRKLQQTARGGGPGSHCGSAWLPSSQAHAHVSRCLKNCPPLCGGGGRQLCHPLPPTGQEEPAFVGGAHAAQPRPPPLPPGQRSPLTYPGLPASLLKPLPTAWPGICQGFPRAIWLQFPVTLEGVMCP